MNPMLTCAIKAARTAGGIIMRASNDLNALKIQSKTHNDFVTEIDHFAENTIIDIIKAQYPKHGFWGEEGGISNPNAECVWIIDPLDGTTNFLHGMPQYCVSIALQQRGVITQAVIFDPNHNDLFTASKGQGAYLNDRRLRVSQRTQLQDTIIGTGFPFRDWTYLDPYLNMLKSMIKNTAGIRRPGSAALDLAYVAAGWYDGFWELGLSTWDVAAGGLLVREAGGMVGNLEGNEGWLISGNIVAANAKVFDQLLKVLAPHLTDTMK